jgi:hypothetical protein
MSDIKKNHQQLDETKLRLIHTHESSDGKKQAKVYKDTEWGEYRVKFYKDGKHLAKADYHTNEVDDAHGTSQLHIKEEIMPNENEMQLDETAASDTLKPNSMPADGMTKSDMLSGMMQSLNGMKKSELVDFFNQSMAQFGPNADLGVPPGAAAGNAATIRAKASPVKEDVDAMFSESELSEEFKTKVSTLIESAVNARLTIDAAKLQESQEVQFNELAEEYKTELAEGIDEYLTHTVNEWVEANKLAVENSIKYDLQESFMKGMHKLFTEHYVDVPEDKYDLLGELEKELETIKQEMNAIQNRNFELATTNEELVRDVIIIGMTKDLTESDSLKFLTLVENLSYQDMTDFQSKLVTIKEAHFSGSDDVITEQEEVIGIASLTEEAKGSSNTDQITDPAMASYINAIARTTKI